MENQREMQLLAQILIQSGINDAKRMLFDMKLNGSRWAANFFTEAVSKAPRNLSDQNDAISLALFYLACKVDQNASNPDVADQFSNLRISP